MNLIILYIYTLFFLTIVPSKINCSEIFRNDTNFDIWKYTEKLEINVSFGSSFVQSFLLIFISEIADKTFIIILIFSAKRKRITTFFASLISILLTNYLSIFIGLSIDILLYKNVIDWIAFFLLVFYGISLLSESYDMSSKKVEDKYFTMIEDEYKQKKKVHRQREVEKSRLTKIEEADVMLEHDYKLNEPILNNDSLMTDNLTNPNNSVEGDDESTFTFYWILFTSIFTAECGDKSQIATITISAVFNIYGVIFGATLALIICVYINFYQGHKIANYLAEKHVNILCGICFLFIGIEILLIKLNYIKF